MAVKMTDRVVKEYIKQVVPGVRPRPLWDTEIKGFGVLVTEKGVASFILNYRFEGRARRYTIGRCAEMSLVAARLNAGELKALIRDGFDPLAQKAAIRSVPTMSDLAAEYLERHAIPNKRPSSLRNDRQMIEKKILPVIGKLRLSAVNRKDIEDLHASLKEKPYAANRVLALLSKMFNLANEWGWTEGNPTVGIKKCHEEPRERCLTVAESQKLQKALDEYPDQNAANAIRLLMFTGSRLGEVIQARWEDFDFGQKMWIKPSHKTKQKRTEHVPIGDDMFDLLMKMKSSGASGPLFPGMKNNSRTTIRRPWRQVCKAAGLVTEESIPGKRGSRVVYRPTVRPHDLRHNFASHLASSGVSLPIVGKLLGHTQVATTMRYAHLQNEPLRAATNKFANLISRDE